MAELRSESRARELLSNAVARANARLQFAGSEERVDADELADQLFAIRGLIEFREAGDDDEARRARFDGRR